MSIEITYFTASMNRNSTGNAISSETLTTSATHAESGATPANAVYVRLRGLATDRYSYAAAPVATASAGAQGNYIGSGDVIWLDAISGNKVSGITSA